MQSQVRVGLGRQSFVSPQFSDFSVDGGGILARTRAGRTVPGEQAIVDAIAAIDRPRSTYWTRSQPSS